MARVSSVLIVGVALAGGSPLRGEVLITHEPPACILAGKFPVIEAAVEAPETPGRLRVYFHTKGAPSWSYTEMKPEGGVFRATLAKPTVDAVEVYYHFEATDTSGGRTTSQQYLVPVVRGPGGCSDPRRMARAVDSAFTPVGRGDAIERTRTAPAGGGKGKAIALIALGAAAAGGGVVALTQRGGTPSPSLLGTFTGTLDGYVQRALGNCSGALDVAPGGTISITLNAATAAASFTFPSGTFTPDFTPETCPPLLTAPVPPVSGQFSQVTLAGSIVSGRAAVGYQTFLLAATISGSTLGGVINVSGGPLGAWSTAVANIHGSKSASASQ